MPEDPDDHADDAASEPVPPEAEPLAAAPQPEQPEQAVEALADLSNPVDPLDSAELESAEAEAPGEAPEPEPGPAVPGAVVDHAVVEQLQAQVAELDRALAAAQRRADEMTAIARRQSDMVEELHTDNRRLRDGEIREAVAPLVRGVARLLDDLARMRTGEGADSADLKFLEKRVGELLHDSGVLPLSPERGTPFDPQVHQATGRATTDDPAADRTVFEVRRAGLRRDDGRVLRAADVVVYRYVAPAPAPAPAPEATAVKEEVA
jgi:molecular chaperone GrpE (heat shock protein)